MTDAQLFIGGQHVKLDEARTCTRLDPVTGDVATRFAAATTRDAEAAVNAAREAFPAWSASTPAHRREVLSKTADILSARAGDFINAMQREIGSTAGWAGFNVMLAAQQRWLQQTRARTDRWGPWSAWHRHNGSMAWSRTRSTRARLY